MLDELRILWRLWGAYGAAEQAAKGDHVKNILSSKTFWFNLAAGVIGVCQSAGLFTVIPAPYGPAVVAVVNLVLRYVTTQPVAVLPQPAS